jgi:hypothetical protein
MIIGGKKLGIYILVREKPHCLVGGGALFLFGGITLLLDVYMKGISHTFPDIKIC